MAKRLVLFNHKGGVSKTTTVYNVGWMLAEQGHRVLLVDADPHPARGLQVSSPPAAGAPAGRPCDAF
jgi:cellulose biosynthesis protein BcsQ